MNFTILFHKQAISLKFFDIPIIFGFKIVN